MSITKEKVKLALDISEYSPNELTDDILQDAEKIQLYIDSNTKHLVEALKKHTAEKTQPSTKELKANQDVAFLAGFYADLIKAGIILAPIMLIFFVAVTFFNQEIFEWLRSIDFLVRINPYMN